MKTLLSSFIVLLFVTFSCKKAEIPIKKHEVGNIITNSFEMGSDYRYQSFFDLGSNSFVSKNIKTSWDLGFQCGENGWHITLNEANLMAVAKIENTPFLAIEDTIGVAWKWDSNTGHLDSTAIGNWRNNNAVFIIDRGMDYEGIHRGFSKVEFQTVSNNNYTFKISNLDGSNLHQVTLEKNNTLNIVSYSISTNSIVTVEPPKENWDLEFTQYTYYFYDHELAYLVTGVLSNRNGVEVTQVFDKEFSVITLDDINKYSFSSAQNTIGYDWKYYDFDAGSYLTKPSKNYIVKSTEGIYYKLHFIDFYNAQGDKGTPTFELQEL